MKDLKIVLFEETLHVLNRWMELKKELGDWDSLVDVQHAKFCSLYSVIENSGLEEEYQEWKDSRNEK